MSEISTNISISPNEYLSKYSLNRNFLKLNLNDKTLYEKSKDAFESGTVLTYIRARRYHEGDVVFYKTALSSTSMYLLSCLDETTDEPKVITNETTHNSYVVSSDDWAIIGLPEDLSASPKDIADNYVLSSKQYFVKNHQDNLALSVHPTGKLGLLESTILYTNLNNLCSDRSTFMYPNEIMSLTLTDSVITGYMRKWENGLLEYDILFRLGSKREKDGVQDLISANNLIVPHRSNNYLYFLTDKDYEIFNQGGNYYATLNLLKEVNLNTEANAFAATIDFPEEFVDTNYMMFTSNIKNVETEAYDIKNEDIDYYDSRLTITGRTIIGHDEKAAYDTVCTIPSMIRNIASESLADIPSENDRPIEFLIDPESELINIDNYAFRETDIKEIVIPKHVRNVGLGAFYNCKKLEKVTIYVNTNLSKLPIIQDNAFFCENGKLAEIVLNYYSDPVTMFAASLDIRESALRNDIDIYYKLSDPNLASFLGYDTSKVTITTIGRTFSEESNPLYSAPISVKANKLNLANSSENLITLVDYVSAKTASFAANSLHLPLGLGEIIQIKDNSITGYDDSSIATTFTLDLTESTYSSITSIADNAFANCKKLTDLTTSYNLKYIGDSAFDDAELTSLTLNLPLEYSLHNDAWWNCANIKKTYINGNGTYNTPQLLSGLNTYNLYVNLNNMFINKDVLSGLIVSEKILFSNLNTALTVDTGKSVILSGLGLNALSYLCNTIEFSDITDMKTILLLLSSNTINSNQLNLLNGTMVYSPLDTNVSYVVEKTESGKPAQVNFVPTYLLFNSTYPHQLNSILFDKLSYDNGNIVRIPYGTTLLNDNSCKASTDDNKKKIRSIYIPKTVQTINNNVFLNNISAELVFERGINLIHAGTNWFTSENSEVTSFIVQSEL